MLDFAGRGDWPLRTRIAVVLAVSVFGVLPAMLPAAVPPQTSVLASSAATALATAGAVSAQLTVNINLTALHPSATKGALDCGAVAQTPTAAKAALAGLTNYDAVNRAVLYPAHYVGQESVLEFPIANRAYAGTVTFSMTLGAANLTDPATHARFAPAPAVLVACWLLINGRPAVPDPGPGLQVVSASNYTSVSPLPLVVAILDASVGATASASAQLSAQGLYFTPGPVAVAGTVAPAGPGASALTPVGSGLPRSTIPLTPPGVGAAAPPVTTPSNPKMGATPTSTPNSALVNNSPGTVAALNPPPLDTGVLPGTAPVNSTANPHVAAARAITQVPAVTALSAASTSPVAHIIQWACAGGETLCTHELAAAGAPTFTYEIWMKDANATRFSLQADVSTPSAPLQQSCDAFGDCSTTTPATMISVGVISFLAPNTTFRVFRKDPSGALTAHYADFLFAAPAQPQEPKAFTATEPQYGQVLLSWQQVPNAVAYRIFEKGTTTTAPPARVLQPPAPAPSNQACDPWYGCGTQPPSPVTLTINKASAGNHTYQVQTEYTQGAPAATLPEATVLVHAVAPPRSVAYLSKNNGTGSAAAAALHLGATKGSDLGTVAAQDGVITGWDQYNDPIFQPLTAAAHYANVTELGLGRRTTCWQWPEKVSFVTIGAVTFCITGNHGSPPGNTTPDGQALANASLIGNAASISATSISLIYTSPTKGQYFATLIPKPGFISGPWGFDWVVSSAVTFDSEGPKYVPHACLTCHGGTYNAANGRVVGASLLPIDPGMLVFPPGASSRAVQEDQVRALNAMVAASSPSAAISDYINGLYGGKVATPGTPAAANYVPAAWSQQTQLFQTVVKPDCLMCHLATPAAQNFGSAANFIQNKALIYAAVCTTHSMPNAEVPYQHFWTATGAPGSTSGNLAGLMLGILGYSSCP